MQVRLPVNGESYLSQGQTVAAAEEGALAVHEQRLDFLDDGLDELLRGSIPLLLRGGTDAGKEVRHNLADEGVDEEGHAGAVEGVLYGSRLGEEVGRMGVSQELGDNGGLGDDVAIVREGRDQTALQQKEWLAECLEGLPRGCRRPYRVDLQVPRLTRLVQVDDDLLVLEPQLLEGDVSAMGPRATMVGVEDDLGGGHGGFGVWEVDCWRDGGIAGSGEILYAARERG